MMTSTDPDLKNRHYGPLIAASVGVFVVIAGFAIWQARPLYRWVKAQRALALVDEIDECIEQKRYAAGRDLAINAYQMASTEPGVLRALARLAMASESPEARFFLEKLGELGEATYEDRRMLLETYLHLADYEGARKLSDELAQEGPDDVALLRLLTETALREERFKDALRSLKRVVELDPDDIKARLLFAQILVVHGSAKEKEMGWQFVWKIAHDRGEFGLQAIDMILKATGLDPVMEAQLIELIRNHVLAEERHLVAALDLDIRLHPENRREIIDEALAQRRDREPKDLIEFYRWLMRLGEYDYLLERLSIETARERGLLLDIYLSTMAHQGKWAEVREILQDATLPLQEARRYMFSALCAHNLGEDETIVEDFLRKSIVAAKSFGAVAEVLNSGSFAESIALYEVAEEAYERSILVDDLAEQAFLGLQRIAAKQGDTLKLRTVTTKFHRRFPMRRDLTARALYLDILTGFDIERGLREALEMVEEEPYRIQSRIIAALAFYRIYDFPSAAGMCESCDVTKMSAAEKAVYAAVTGASGRPEVARTVAGQIEESALTELLPEERRLLAPWEGGS